MASGGTMTQRMDNSLTVQDHLKVHGTGISPRPPTRAADDDVSRSSDITSALASSRPSSVSSNSADIAPEETYTVLQSVVSINKALEGQIDALRLRLDVESKHHATETQKIVIDKNKEIQQREEEIDNLQDSLVNRDERIQILVKTSSDKDKLIQERSGELNELQQLVRQTEDYASRLYKQVGRLREDKRHLESDTLYKEQNSDIKKLRHELKELREKCATMEKELDRAKTIITQQNLKITKFENEKNEMARNFKEELDKASRAMRQEVERMREVMNQNYEEMRNLREQNKAMHDDVKDIKDLILQGKTPRDEEEEQEMTPSQARATNINLSSYLMTPEKSQYPLNKSSGPQRRPLDHLMNHKVPRPQPSPSPVHRSNSRVNLGKPSRTSLGSSQAVSSRSTGQSSVVNSNTSQAGLPAIVYGPREKTRWQSAAVPADRKNQRLCAASSAKRGTSKK